MTLEQIRQAVISGIKVYWYNSKNVVIVDNNDYYVNISNEELESLEELYNENATAFYTTNLKG